MRKTFPTRRSPVNRAKVAARSSLRGLTRALVESTNRPPAPRLNRMRALDRRTDFIETVTVTPTQPFFMAAAKKHPAPPPETLFGTGFKNCCGIGIIYGFAGTTTSATGSRNNFTMKEVEADLVTKLEENDDYGMLLIALNEDQVPLYNKLLAKYEFYPCVKDFYHEGHEKNLTLYAKVINTKTKKGTIPVEISSCGHRDEPPA